MVFSGHEALGARNCEFSVEQARLEAEAREELAAADKERQTAAAAAREAHVHAVRAAQVKLSGSCYAFRSRCQLAQSCPVLKQLQ